MSLAYFDTGTYNNGLISAMCNSVLDVSDVSKYALVTSTIRASDARITGGLMRPLRHDDSLRMTSLTMNINEMMANI